MDDLSNDLLGAIESSTVDKSSSVGKEESAKKLVSALKDDGKKETPEGKHQRENKELFENMKNALSDENYKSFMDNIINDDGKGDSSPSTANPNTANSQEQDFVKNLEKCMQQLKEEEDAGMGADFFENFMKTFENAMDKDESFSKSMEYLMSGMLSKNVLSDSLKEIVDLLEPYVLGDSCPGGTEKERYTKQLEIYKSILEIYENSSEDLSPDQLAEVNAKLQELQNYGSPPQHIMDQLRGTTEQEPEDDTFEDFVKNMGLTQNLGQQEQEMIKQLSTNPDELNQIMQDMAEEIKGGGEEPCKQQ